MTTPLRVLADRGIELRDGDAYHLQWIHTSAYEDTPVLDTVRRIIREEVVQHVATTGRDVEPDSVVVHEVTPEELDETWRTEYPGEPYPMRNAYALVGHWRGAR